MSRVIRLMTVADLGADVGPHQMSVAARHEAVLDDGRRVVLLDGRGWGASLRGPGASEGDAWAFATEREIAETARVVVGPDEPFGGRSQADMADGHWQTLAGTLRAYGVAVDAAELRELPHEVVLSDRLRARIDRGHGIVDSA